MHLDQDIPLFERWALCICQVGGEIWVGSMAGEIVALDEGLCETRRWQAHKGAVSGIHSDDLTYDGDVLVKCGGKVLAGSFKKAVTKVQCYGDKLYIGTYERVLYINEVKHPKIAAFHVSAKGHLVRDIRHAEDLRLSTKGLYGSILAPDGWLLIAGADGNLKVVSLVAA